MKRMRPQETGERGLFCYADRAAPCGCPLSYLVQLVTRPFLHFSFDSFTEKDFGKRKEERETKRGELKNHCELGEPQG